jgi:hypothetical protein
MTNRTVGRIIGAFVTLAAVLIITLYALNSLRTASYSPWLRVLGFTFFGGAEHRDGARTAAQHNDHRLCVALSERGPDPWTLCPEVEW